MALHLLYCKHGTWLGLTLRVSGKSGYDCYLSMTSNNGFLEDGVCAVLFPDDILL